MAWVISWRVTEAFLHQRVSGLGLHRTQQPQAWEQRGQGSTPAAGATAPTRARILRCLTRATPPAVHPSQARGGAILPHAGRQGQRYGLCPADVPGCLRVRRGVHPLAHLPALGGNRGTAASLRQRAGASWPFLLRWRASGWCRLATGERGRDGTPRGGDEGGDDEQAPVHGGAPSVSGSRSISRTMSGDAYLRIKRASTR